MRCLTLADVFTAKGAECKFICREHEGNLIEFIRSKGYVTHVLPVAQEASEASPVAGQEDFYFNLPHAQWLGATQAQDAEACAPILAAQRFDWLVVDHYAMDQHWEVALAPYYRQLMVIDDLADRAHNCDLLLDQNLGRQPAHYAQWVPAHCRVLTGPHYALLRPEFAALRTYSLQRRHAQPALRQLLITMGGVDQPNATGQVLQALKTCAMPAKCHITVVMGSTAPWLQNVQELAAQMPWPTDVLVNVSDMAQRMADSDLAIGAAGSTSWERCCLGLPTLMVVLADNQKEAAEHLEHAGAAHCLSLNDHLQQQIQDRLILLLNQSEQLSQMSICASEIADGKGFERIVLAMTSPLNNSI